MDILIPLENAAVVALNQYAENNIPFNDMLVFSKEVPALATELGVTDEDVDNHLSGQLYLYRSDKPAPVFNHIADPQMYEDLQIPLPAPLEIETRSVEVTPKAALLYFTHKLLYSTLRDAYRVQSSNSQEASWDEMAQSLTQ